MLNDKNQKLVLQFLPLAEKLAKSYFKKTPPQVQLDELISAAYMGLVDAATRYEEGKDFELFAKYRIIGEIKDYLRSLQWDRHNSKVGSLPDNFDVAAETEPENFDEVLDGVAGKKLSTIAKNIIRMYYGECLPIMQIAEKMNLSGARISQLIKENLTTLRTSAKAG